MASRLAALVFLLLAPAGATGSQPAVALSREGGVFRLEASFEARAPRPVAWQVLTDYDGMTRFISSLRRSRVVSRAADGMVIEQEGLVRLMIFSRRVLMTLKVVAQPPDRIDFTNIGANEFEEYDGSWTVAESSGISKVSYQLFAEMKDSMVPRGVARRILEKSVTDQLQQVQREIERRAARAP